jgi:hypothetical protein
MSRRIPDELIKNTLRTTVGRISRFKQGESVYGVCSYKIDDNTDFENWTRTAKLFKDRERADDYLDRENSLIENKNRYDVLYRATIAVADSRYGRDTVIVSPDEETEIILSDITILQKKFSE